MQPTNLDEAVDYLLSRMTEEDKVAYRDGAPVPHFTLGMSMRNEWGLWFNETPLGKWFQSNDIHHGDDRSGVIFDALRAKLKGEVFDIKAAAEWYKKYWEWSATVGPKGHFVIDKISGRLIYPFEDDYPKHDPL